MVTFCGHNIEKTMQQLKVNEWGCNKTNFFELPLLLIDWF